MRVHKKKLNVKKAIFPAIMTILAFLSFVFVYWLVTYRSITPFYFKGLLFAIPFIVFGVLTYITAQGHLKMIASTIITIIFIIAFLVGSLHTLMILSFEAATVDTTDLENYERVVRITDDSLTTHFPKEIPRQAENIDYFHQSPFVQAGEKFQLKFQTDSESIQDYQKRFSKEAIKMGTIAEIEKETLFDYSDISPGSTIYLFVSDPYQANDWNHGEYSLAAINETNNEMVFLMEDW
ncbi:MAG: hypothetical protein L0I93_01700 [Atopostipes suicloacalis]|nr:hypothetical protein [Atopostipes suicloacalis]